MEININLTGGRKEKCEYQRTWLLEQSLIHYSFNKHLWSTSYGQHCDVAGGYNSEQHRVLALTDPALERGEADGE